MNVSFEALRHVLLFAMIFLGITAGFCLLMGILGPQFTDRLVAVNMIGTKIILMIAALSIYLNEHYLLDVCLIYALASFLSVAVLSRTYLIAFNRNLKRRSQIGSVNGADKGDELGEIPENMEGTARDD
jgi:multicomponent Na+:H+ antiporter subunit F